MVRKHLGIGPARVQSSATIRHNRRREARRRRLNVERLEERYLLTDISWNNPAGGAWETAANWSPAQVPTTSDNAFITLDGTYTVTVSAPRTVTSLTLGASTGTQTLALNDSTFRETGASSVAAHGVLNLNAGTLTDDGGLTVNGGSIGTPAPWPVRR